MESFEMINRCLVCGIDMGDCNPRQLCNKTYCGNQYTYEENTEFMSSFDNLLNCEIFYQMNNSTQFKLPMDTEHINFLLDHRDDTQIIKEHDILREGSIYNIKLMGKQIIRYEKLISQQPTWKFYRYPFVNPMSPIFTWNLIIVNMLTPDCNTNWARQEDIIQIIVDM